MLGGREGGGEISNDGGKEGSQGVACLNQLLPVAFSSQSKTQPHQSNAQKQRAAEKPPVFA